jgi:hypothetical protein
MSLNRVWARRVRRAALALCAAAVLSACGGGDRSEPFVPGRIFAFGDEMSVLDTTTVPGQTLKYSVNGFNTTDTSKPDCAVNPLWIQTLANNYSMGFKECPGAYTNLSAVTRAKVGAKVVDVQAQVAQYLAGDSPVGNDLVTFLVGSHDVIDTYEAWKAGTLSHDAAVQQVKDAAVLLAAQVHAVIQQSGAAVLIATVPYLSGSPYAIAAETALPGSIALIDELVTAFNDALISSDVGGGSKGLASYGYTGREYGLIQNSTSWIKALATSTHDTSRSYSTRAMCLASAPLPTCTANTLDTANGADVTLWAWADATRPGPLFHTNVGNRAVTLAKALPF